MKNAIVVLLIVFFSMSCSSKKAVAEEKNEPVVQFRDDFRAVSDKKKAEFLEEMKANKENASVLILTKGYKGGNITVSNEKKVLYKGVAISNLETGIAETIRIDNTINTKITDKFSKQEIVIASENTRKYKFIYVMKDNAQKGNPYTITFSNTLRPLK